MNDQQGFTLVEVLIVVGIVIILTSFLFSNFSGAKANLSQAAAQLNRDIRDVQSKATTAAAYQGSLRCGFGLRYVNPTSYALYVGPPASDLCKTRNRNFDATDADMSIVSLQNKGIEISAPFSDIFFEPPDPVTFVNNSSTSLSAAHILLWKPGAACGADPNACRSVCLYTTGRIDTRNGATCP